MITPVPASLADAVLARVAEGRVLLGVSGGPGSGKSTLANSLAEHWTYSGAVVVPMDGFHLSNAQLERAGLADRKGAPESFDAVGLGALLAGIRAGITTSAPAYSRETHDVVPDAIDIPEACRIVIVEGNYLGLSTDPWLAVRSHLDWLWRLDVPWERARERLIARRIATGRDPTAAREWVDTVDAANARLVTSSDADVVLEWSGEAWREAR
jgi:pantothenate kinase